MEKMIKEQMAAIRECQAIREGIEFANRYIYKHNHGRRIEHGSAIQELYKIELDMWREFAMFGLGATIEEGKEIKKMCYDRFYSEDSSISHLLNPERVEQSGWMLSEENKVRDTLKRMFDIADEEKS